MFTLVFCLQTIKRNEPAPHSGAFLGQRLLSLTLHGRSTALNCAIPTVQYQPYKYRRIVYGHVVGLVRCDWPFTFGYIINNNKSREYRYCWLCKSAVTYTHLKATATMNLIYKYTIVLKVYWTIKHGVTVSLIHTINKRNNSLGSTSCNQKERLMTVSARYISFIYTLMLMLSDWNKVWDSKDN